MLRLVAILPPEPISGMVRNEQEKIATAYGPKHVLRTPPHITLIPPVQVNPAEAYLLEEICESVIKRYHPFSIRLFGYGAFNRNVVFIRILPNEELTALQVRLANEINEIIPEAMSRYIKKRFNPHLTIAHKDVKGEVFDTIWDEVSTKRLDIKFPVRAVTILEHTLTGWQSIRTITLSKKIF